MKTVAFSKSKIPDMFSSDLIRIGLSVAPEEAINQMEVFIYGAMNTLNSVEPKNKPAAFLFDESNGEINLAAILTYTTGEDGAKQKELSWTFNKEDIPNGAKIVKLSEIQCHSMFYSYALRKFSLAYDRPSDLVDLGRSITRTLSKWLQENASEEEEVVLEADNLFRAKAIVEDQKVVKSFELLGEVKAYIKEDDLGLNIDYV